MGKTVSDFREVPPVSETDPILIQSRLFDTQIEELAKTYRGKWVAFCDGRVLASGDTDEEAIARIRDEDKGLPFVVDIVDPDAEPDYMGGPMGE